MIDACRRASARTITAVIPYFGYARADRKVIFFSSAVYGILNRAGLGCPSFPMEWDILPSAPSQYFGQGMSQDMPIGMFRQWWDSPVLTLKTVTYPGDHGCTSIWVLS